MPKSCISKTLKEIKASKVYQEIPPGNNKSKLVKQKLCLLIDTLSKTSTKKAIPKKATTTARKRKPTAAAKPKALAKPKRKPTLAAKPKAAVAKPKPAAKSKPASKKPKSVPKTKGELPAKRKSSLSPPRSPDQPRKKKRVSFGEINVPSHTKKTSGGKIQEAYILVGDEYRVYRGDDGLWLLRTFIQDPHDTATWTSRYAAGEFPEHGRAVRTISPEKLWLTQDIKTGRTTEAEIKAKTFMMEGGKLIRV